MAVRILWNSARCTRRTRGERGDVDDEVLWRQDGSNFSVHYHSTPVRKGSELVGSVITFGDISRRKKAEEEKDDKA